jgi:tetratricopeptide (TPR) repeat protein
LASNQWNGSERDYSQLLIKAAAAVDLCPDNVQYAYALNSYRWHSVEAFYDRQSPQYEEFARRIVTELDRSRFLCPTFGPIYCLSGQIEMFVLNRSEGAADIRTGYRLAPSDASCCFAVGRLDANCERWDESLDAFTRAMKLDSSTTPLIMDVYLNQANRPDLAIAILHDDWDSLFHLAQELNAPANASRDPNPAMADVAKKRAVAALERAAASPAASASVVSNMAEIALQRGEYRSAADLFRRAISMNYANAEWHLKLARSLAKLGQGQNAYREARIASQVRPGWVDASRLVDELAKLPGVQGNAE